MMYAWGSEGNVHEWILSFYHESPGDKSGSQAWQYATLSSKPWLVGGFMYTRIHHLQHTTFSVHLRPPLLLQGMLWRDKGIHCCFQTIPLFWHGAWCVIGIQWTLCVTNNEWDEAPSRTNLCLSLSLSEQRLVFVWGCCCRFGSVHGVWETGRTQFSSLVTFMRQWGMLVPLESRGRFVVSNS